jgi:hypothetical protein
VRAFPSRSTAAQNEELGHDTEVRTPKVAEECRADGANAAAGGGNALTTPTKDSKSAAIANGIRAAIVRGSVENMPIVRAHLPHQ